MQRAGISVFQLTTSMEVFNFGLVLAEMAGFDRPCGKHEPDYADRLVSMHNEESWVQVSRPPHAPTCCHNSLCCDCTTH